MKKLDIKEILTDKREYIKEILSYIFLAGLTVILLRYVLGLWNKDLTIPFSYTIDAFGPLKEVKNMILGNGLYDMPQLAAPLGGTEELTIKGFLWHFLWLKVLTFFTDSPGLVVNLYFLIGFPITAMTTFFVFRKFNVKRVLSIVMSVAYCFLPYHFYKGTFHIFYASYYLIPLASLVIIFVITQNRNINIFASRKRGILFSVIVCALVGISDTYYGAFLCILLFFSGIWASCLFKKIKPFIDSLIYIAITGFSVIAAISPTIIYSLSTKVENVFSSERSLFDIELYSLKLSHLLLPMHGHRIDFLNQIRLNYDANSISAPESSYTALGIIMAFGLLISVFFIFVKSKNLQIRIIETLGKINLFILLLCTIGGLNVFIGMFVTTSIRSYARIVVFLAFFSVLSFAILCNVILEKIKGRYKKIVEVMVSIILLGVVIVDQTSTEFSKLGYYEVFSNTINMPYEETKELYDSDKKFVSEIEKNIQSGDMILQLPIVADSIYDTFPNGSSGAYGLIRPFLHSSEKVHWSHGSQKGDENDKWLSVLSRYSYEDIIKIASIVGFKGVYIDSRGVTQEDLNFLLEYLNDISKSKPLISEKGDLYYYDLSAYNKKIKNMIGDRFDEYRDTLLQLGYLKNYYIFDSDELYYDGNYEIKKNVELKEDAIQFGPYLNLPAGKYKVTLHGNNLKNTSVQAYTNGDSVGHNLNLEILEYSNTRISYVINSDSYINALECFVQSTGEITLEYYEIEKVYEKVDLNQLNKDITVILKGIK